VHAVRNYCTQGRACTQGEGRNMCAGWVPEWLPPEQGHTAAGVLHHPCTQDKKMPRPPWTLLLPTHVPASPPSHMQA
jgi:hypothetical protein